MTQRSLGRGIDLLWDHLDGERAAEALAVGRKLVAEFPRAADAWHAFAYAAAVVGEDAEAKAAFARVWELDTEEASAFPCRYPADEFEDFVAAAAARLDDRMRAALEEVTVCIEEYPARWIVDDDAEDPRLLGLFAGPTWADLRSTGTGASWEAPRIFLFQRNLEREFQDSAELTEEIAVTLYHELGHFLGLDEDDLEARGLD